MRTPYGEPESDCGVGLMMILKVRHKLQKNSSIRRILDVYCYSVNRISIMMVAFT